jgi:hypothetical protein
MQGLPVCSAENVSDEAPEPAARSITCRGRNQLPWQESSTARDLTDQAQFFRVTHQFHPLCGQVLALVDRRLTWGEDRVYYHGEAGKLCRMNAQWTSLAAVDAFVMTSAGRSSLRVADLLQLVALIEQQKNALRSKSSKRKRQAASSK